MKKLNIRAEITRGTEVLTRTQLRKVLGGNNPHTGCGDPSSSSPESCYNCCIQNSSASDCASRCF